MMNKKYAVSPNLFNLWPSSILVYGVENTFGCPVPPDSKMIPLKSTPAAGLKRSDHTPFRNNAPSITLFCRMPGLPPTCQLSHHVLQPDQSFATRPRSTTRSPYSLAACASPRLVLPPMSTILGVGSLPIPFPDLRHSDADGRQSSKVCWAESKSAAQWQYFAVSSRPIFFRYSLKQPRSVSICASL